MRALEEGPKRGPCLTLRGNTERPVTVTLETNVLIGQDAGRLSSELSKILEGRTKEGFIPPLWDGHAGKRITEGLQTYASQRFSVAVAVSLVAGWRPFCASE